MMKKHKATKTTILISSLGVTLLLLLSGCSLSHGNEGQNSPGRIAFMWDPERDGSRVMNLILTEGDGNTLRFVGHFTGSPAFSPDGNQIAVGCPPSDDDHIVSDLCILDINNFVSTRRQIQVGVYNARYAITSKLALPEQCLEYQYRQGDSLKGILSTNWSPDSDKLLIVCGDLRTQEVCILPLDGKSYCWDQSASEDVFRAVWSPVDENVIALGGLELPKSQIYLVDPEGKNPKFLAAGWNPEWSPGGDQIAYVENIIDPEDGRSSQGIAVVKPDGSNHKWLFLPNPEDSSSYDSNYISLSCTDSGDQLCRLAWSPDGRYIAFSGIYVNLYNFSLFRLDISSGEITYLVDSDIFDYIVAEPDWGPE